jgi:hypothetical protein
VVEFQLWADYTSYMTTIVLVFVVMVLFVIAVISPHAAGKIQRKTDEEADWLKRISNWLWDPLTWWTKKSIEMTRKIIIKVTSLGKKTHRKL